MQNGNGLRQQVIDQVAEAILSGRTDALPGDATMQEIALAIDVADRVRWIEMQELITLEQTSGGAA